MATPAITILDGNGSAKTLGALQDPSNNFIYSVTQDNARATYSFSAFNAAVITTASKTILSIQGSATKTVRVMKIIMSITAATAAQCNVQLQRTSALGTGGTAVSPSAAKHDTNSAAATAVVSHYTTGAQSQGTAVGGPIASMAFSQAVTTTAPTFLGDQHMLWLFPQNGSVDSQGLVLRGAADFLEIQTATAIGTTPALSYSVVLCEDGS